MSAETPKYIDIVIPVYNEGENMLSLLKAFDREVQTPIRILICYDNDDDSTLTALHNGLNVQKVPVDLKFFNGRVHICDGITLF